MLKTIVYEGVCVWKVAIVNFSRQSGGVCVAENSIRAIAARELQFSKCFIQVFFRFVVGSGLSSLATEPYFPTYLGENY